MEIGTVDLFFLWLKALIKNDAWQYLVLEANTSRFKNHDGSAYRDIPWWRINRWEDIYTWLQREIYEETRISDIEIESHVGMFLSPNRIPTSDDDYWLILSIYIVSITSHTSIKLSEEHKSYKRCNLEETKEKLSHKYTDSFLQKL